MRRRRRWLTCLPRSSRFTRPLTFPGLGRRTVRTERPPPFGRFRCLHAPFRMFAGENISLLRVFSAWPPEVPTHAVPPRGGKGPDHRDFGFLAS